MIASESYIRAIVLVGFADFARHLGGEPDELLREAGIDPAALNDVDRLISYDAAGSLCELAAERFRRPSFGLEWALRMSPHFSNTGPMLLLTLFLRDVRDWVDMAIRYYHHNCNGYSIQLIEDGDLVRGRYFGDPLAERSRQQIEHGFANAVLAARERLNREIGNPVQVRFRHARPKDATLHQQIFACPIEFDAEYDEIVYRRAILDEPLGGNLRMLKPLVDTFIRYRLRRLPQADQSMTTTVALAIPGVLGAGKCSAEFVADVLGVNPKKLQRLLSAEGTTFSAILEQVRRNMARQLLTESGAPVARIAGLLDYSSTAPFTIAFRRWFGLSPMQFRKADLARRQRSAHDRRAVA